MMLSIILSIFMRPPIVHIANPYLKLYMIIGGDFNCYEYDSDKFGGNVSLAAYLTEFRNTFNLVDVWHKIHPHSSDLSWFNSDFSIGSRLDKFFFQNRFFSLCFHVLFYCVVFPIMILFICI